jgi:hypothetical protein
MGEVPVVPKPAGVLEHCRAGEIIIYLFIYNVVIFGDKQNKH